jgi:hypothetical protein
MIDWGGGTRDKTDRLFRAAELGAFHQAFSEEKVKPLPQERIMENEIRNSMAVSAWKSGFTIGLTAGICIGPWLLLLLEWLTKAHVGCKS